MIKHAISLILLENIMANKKQGRVTYKSNTTKAGYIQQPGHSTVICRCGENVLETRNRSSVNY